MYEKLARQIDNSPLIVFRIIFGLLFVCESFGAIFTGWVRINLVETHLTFSHIYMDWLQPLPGNGMYYYFILMGLASIGVMLGYRYRWSIILLTVLWAGCYYMQKTSYNNHYYLMLIICLYMCFMPANRYASLDVKQGRVTQKLTMFAAYSYLFVIQIAILYFYATVAKFYPDWLDGTFSKNLYGGLHNSPEFFKKIFAQPWFYMSITYLGILFDGLIVPLLCWKKTRNFAVAISLVFHLFNSVTLHIGVFPYFALSFALFFYPPNDIRRWFFKKKPVAVIEEGAVEKAPIGLWSFLGVFLFVQLLLPLRHWVIPGDVLWTDEGHRLSWRMMLRQRAGYTNYTVEDKATGKRWTYNLEEKLMPKQNARLSSPDMIWQMAQYIRREYAAQGIEVRVFADSWVSINQRPYSVFVDPGVDLAAVKWNYFGHNTWIAESPLYKN
ncbi:HTTM domain-containing protein [Flavobacterium sp. JP2137]|uniref:HTTM domain-containing protein n=1 Tax=Flavobacterium sp. JP2137 TaxID=3414510 RepID=UPI003D2FD1CB